MSTRWSSGSENPWRPTAVVAEINERTGAGLRLTGLADQVGGTSSAAYVRWPDGRDAALTRTETPPDRMRQTAEILETARSKGLPVPRHDLVLGLSDGRTAIVQERLPGRHAERIDAAVIDMLVEMNDRFAGLLAGRQDVPAPPALPGPGPGGHPWLETLGRHSDRTRRVFERMLAVDDDLGGAPFTMNGDDLVHTDYSLGNVLWTGHTELSGVVDWNRGAARGDRRFALLCARVELEKGSPEAAERLDEILDTTIEPDLLRVYWVHWTVHNVHWAINHGFPPGRIEADLELAERYLA